jgi:hypothetical protein
VLEVPRGGLVGELDPLRSVSLACLRSMPLLFTGMQR